MRTITVWLCLLALGVAARAEAAAVEGRDYVRLNIAHTTSDPGRVVVTEFFSYQCSHCDGFSKSFAAWSRAQPADVLVERMPVALGRSNWEPAARAFLVYNEMKVLAKLDEATFDAIHRQGVKLESEKQLTAWVATQGVDTARFASLYRSFGVDAQLRKADERARAYQVPSIPALVIDGRYMVSISDNGNFQPQLAVVNELIARARKEKGAK